MDALTRKILRKRVEITVGGRPVAAEIEQIVEVHPEDTKFNPLLEILGRMYNEDLDCRTLIFVDRQEAADNFLRKLMRKGYLCMSLHGGKDQVDRDSTIADFKVVPIVIATSVAARGLYVKQLNRIIWRTTFIAQARPGKCLRYFITPDQDRYSADIYWALKASNAKEQTKEKEFSNEELNKTKPIWTQPWGYHTGGVRHILQEFDQRMGGPPSSTSPSKASLNSRPSSMFPNGMLYLIFILAVVFLQVYL